MDEAGITKLTKFIRSGAARNPAQARTFLEAEVAPYFDFNYMALWAAGPARRTMTAGQRAQLQDRITPAFMTSSFGVRFLVYRNVNHVTYVDNYAFASKNTAYLCQQ